VSGVISKDHRFHGYNKLTAIYRHGKTVRAGMLSLKYSHNPRRSDYRLAVVVSRKVHKSAVVRNRIRRRLFEQFRKYEHLFGPTDMVVTVFADSVADMPSKDLDKLVKKLTGLAGFKPKNTAADTSNGPAHGIVIT
jgi:ribonuclease P protein component